MFLRMHCSVDISEKKLFIYLFIAQSCQCSSDKPHLPETQLEEVKMCPHLWNQIICLSISSPVLIFSKMFDRVPQALTVRRALTFDSCLPALDLIW